MTILEEREKLYPVRMLDVYSGNEWNPSEELAKGTRGIICKAGQGGYASLPKDFIANCESAGLPWGVYWLIDSRYDSGYHMRAIKDAFPDMNFGPLGWWWDCEKPKIGMSDATYRKTPYRGNGLIEAVIDKFTGWSGQSGGIYTAPGFARLLGWYSPLFKFRSLAKKLAAMPLWVAQYNDFIMAPDLCGVWSEWLWWQYREGPDYNYFNGNEAKFQAYLDGYVVTPPPPTQDKYTGTVISPWGVNVRTGPGISFTKITTLLRYAEVRGTELNEVSSAETWLKITYPVDGWVAAKYNNRDLVRVEEI
ncbi:MAG: hypothetical protein Fur0043_18940 [Anaerolineales bacterium]